jgi:hypothetical protein
VRKLTPLQLPTWSLPVLALVIAVPIIGAFALGGPGAGTAAGALAIAVILFLAARAAYDEEIEVAPSPAGGDGGVLAVVTVPVEGVEAVEAIRRARGAGRGESSEVLVLAPALNSRLSTWASDLEGARLRAQERLAVSLAGLAKAGIKARGQVGDSDAVQATEDALRSYPAREVVFVTDEGDGGDPVDEVRRRLDRPVTHVATHPA